MTTQELRPLEPGQFSAAPLEMFVLIPPPSFADQIHVDVSKQNEPNSRTIETAGTLRSRPDATYRLQFHAGFTFRDARGLVPYLAALGITHVYASPYLRSVAGSHHGYDIVDQSSINPEIGSEQDFDDFVRELHAHGLGQILDVVPNHMGVATNDNAWWSDVLENGPSSPYASFFDIDWMPLKPDLANKVLLPVLGDQFGRVLEDGQLTLRFEEGAFVVQYFERRFPIGMRTSALLLNHRLDELKEQLSASPNNDSHLGETDIKQIGSSGDGSGSAELMEYLSILTAIGHLPPRTETDPDKINERRREQEVTKRRLRELCQSSPEVNAFVTENVRLFNGQPGDPASFDLLDQLLLDQAYRLANWRVAADEINYRRFFDVNELAAICMENPEVFEKAHSLILRLINRGQVDGLRIDHPDGLYDPSEYLRRLRQVRPGCSDGAASDTLQRVTDAVLAVSDSQSSPNVNARTVGADSPLYLVVEKILGRGEHLPNDWPIDGTTGYEFLNVVNGLFVDRNGARAFDRLYANFAREPMNFRELVYHCKQQIMEVSMSGEISVLGHQLNRISEQNRLSRDFTLSSLTDTLREIIACFPVYRTYIDETGVSEQDRQYVEQAVARAKRRNPAINTSIFDFVRDVLLLRFPGRATEMEQQTWRRFVGKFQQVTGPVMAKGAEDTACYIYNRLVSLNEVGGDPDKFGTTVASFHQQNQDRQAHWPHALLSTSTHDTKRTEDVRARLNVLSEIPGEWQRRLGRWSRINTRKKHEADGEQAPSRNDEYLLYQTLVGTWPLEELQPANRALYLERIQQYMLKAIHEAKVHTSWISPHAPYEQALAAFIAALLADSSKNAFLVDFVPFAQRVAACGLWNSLSQTLLKLTSPGVPDTYQGCELWDFSLVDPDNRRPVDFENRRQMLEAMQEQLDGASIGRSQLIRDLVERPLDGRLKLFVISQILHERHRHRQLFTGGDYLPIEASGRRQDHVCAFVRQTPECAAVVVVPRLIAQLTDFSGAPPVGEACWQETRLTLPADFAECSLHNLFTDEILPVEKNSAGCELMLSDVFRSFPVAVLKRPRRTPHEARAESLTQRSPDEMEAAVPLIDPAFGLQSAAS